MQETIVLYPAPGIGHIVSMVELGKLLSHHHAHKFSITILLTTGLMDKPSIDSYIRTISTTFPSIAFRRFPHLTVNLTRPCSGAAIAFEFVRQNATHVNSALNEISKTSIIRAFVIDLFCTTALSTASSLGIPVYYFFTSGAACLAFALYVPKIHEQVNESFKDLKIDLHNPGNPPLKASHMPEPLLDRETMLS